MAPNRKKKKGPNNPARGFATTSIASIKSQSFDEDASESKAESNTTVHSENEGERMQTKVRVGVDFSTKEFSSLSAEELEEHVERSDLQRVLDEFGDKCNRDASRQVTKQKTERRLLRPQAAPFDARFWVPEETTELVLKQVASERKQTHLLLDRKLTMRAPSASAEDVSLRLWTLQRTLLGLGIPKEWARRSMKSLLEDEIYAYRNIPTTTMNSIWGLDNCLDWLASSCDAKDLPNYDSELRKSHSMKVSKSRHLSMVVATDGTSQSNSSPTALKSPTLDGEAQPRTAIASPSLSEKVSLVSPGSGSDDDDDGDLDPDQLVGQYLYLKTRLYEIDSNLYLGMTKHPKSKSRIESKEHNTPSPAVGKILQKLRRIQSDVLFDPVEAEAEWIETRNSLARQAAERQRYDIGNNVRGLHFNKVLIPSPTLQCQSEVHEEDSVEEAFGDFFSSLPEASADTNSICSVKDVISGENLVVRDFGEYTGISPRRIFEEACRARDAGCRIAYKLVSATSFSKRHSLFVEWSRKQDSVFPPPISSVSFEVCDRSVMIEMATISVPSVVQSEGYVSTVALYSVFAFSSKEEKTYLRLPAVWRDLFLELRSSQKDINDMNDRRELRELRQMVESYKRTNTGMIGESAEEGASSKESQVANRRPDIYSNAKEHLSNSDDLIAMWATKASSSTYQQMKETRMRLPVWSYRKKILSAIESHRVVIICGETGCGKSTQVPAYILEHELSSNRSCLIYCTEPRRIAAISLARRVSEELGEQKGLVGTSRSIVGYAIRLESRIASTSRLIYATTGILLRMLEGADGLEGISHVVLDEVHERSIDSDFLLIVLKKILIIKPTLKVLLMSATVDAQRFSGYFSGAPVINIPGRTFPVETKYLEDVVEITNYNSHTFGDRSYSEIIFDNDDDDDNEANDDAVEHSTKCKPVENLKSYSVKTRQCLANFDEIHINFDLIVKLLEKLALEDAYFKYSTAILVFLPGLAEIRRLNDTLAGHPSFSRNWIIHVLHSALASEVQEKAFILPPEGTRKIILATNIAETGVTIPDITCVIDTGKHKEMRFDERRQLSRLIETFVSRANAKQRRGRAGRVQDGLCFHLYTKYRHDHLMPEQQTPEMLRLSLQDLVLRVKICKLGLIEKVLSETLDPPSSKNIRRAIDGLVDVKALTTAEELTSLGRQLAKLPLDVFLGKLILLGSLFMCLDVTLTMAAMLSCKSPFFAPIGSRARAKLARTAFKKGDSDLLTDYNAYDAWRRISINNKALEYQFCQKNSLSQQTLTGIEDLKAQLTTSLVDAGFIQLEKAELASFASARTFSGQRPFITTPDRYNVNTHNETVITTIIGWSFYPKVLSRNGKGWRNVANNQTVSLSPTSVNKGSGNLLKWLAFYHIMQSSTGSYNAFETTSLDDFAVLFCGEADFKLYSGVVVIDGNRIRLKFDDWRTMFAVKTLRARIRQIMDQSFRNPGVALTAQQHVWLDIWQDICSRGVKSV